MTIPGVSFYSSLLITAELGEIERFDEAKEAVSYAGLDPTVRESGDSRTEGGISKRGSGDLRWILVQCVYGGPPMQRSVSWPVLRTAETAKESQDSDRGDGAETAGLDLPHAATQGGIRPTRSG